MIDETHDASRTSWVASANGHPTFPIQNLPLGVFSPKGGPARGGVAIGDSIFDIGAALEAELFTGAVRDAAEAPSGRTLNPLLEAGAAAGGALRRGISAILDAGGDNAVRMQANTLIPAVARCTCRPRRRLHRFLCRHPSRTYRGHHQPAGKSVAAKL